MEKKIEFDHSKLRGKIREIYGTEEALAKEAGLNRSSLSKRLNGNIDFSVREIYKICALLQIPAQNLGDFFFTKRVRKHELDLKRD